MQICKLVPPWLLGLSSDNELVACTRWNHQVDFKHLQLTKFSHRLIGWLLKLKFISFVVKCPDKFSSSCWKIVKSPVPRITWSSIPGTPQFLCDSLQSTKWALVDSACYNFLFIHVMPRRRLKHYSEQSQVILTPSILWWLEYGGDKKGRWPVSL